MRLLPWLLLIGCDDPIHRACDEYTPTYDGVICLIDTHCIHCHSTTHTNPPVSSTVFPDVLDRDLEECRGDYVVPGDPGASRLWRMVSGELTEDDLWGAMPFSARVHGGWESEPILPASEIEHVRAWIEQLPPCDA